MISSRLVLVFLLFITFQSCQEKPDPSPLHAEILPANAKPIAANIYAVNSWSEKGQFFVTGICTNIGAEWQKIWLNIVPLDATGKALSISKHASVIVPTFSDAIPPSGRSSFMATWPETDFSGKPSSCRITVAGAIQPPAGPILVVPTTNSLKLFSSAAPGAASEESAWQVFGTLSNPLDMPAPNPRLEILLYSADNRLWYSTVLSPDDPATKGIFNFDEREGPMLPKEERHFNLRVGYQALPQALQAQKIGRIDILPFQAR